MERCAGGIVLGDSGTLALVMSAGSTSWLFPKGRIEPGESDEEAARREIEEETGLADLEYIDDLGSFVRPAVSKEEITRPEKHVRMFLFAAAPHAPIGRAGETDEIRDARWVPYREAVELLGSPHPEWFIADRAWYASVFERVRQAIQRD